MISDSRRISCTQKPIRSSRPLLLSSTQPDLMAAYTIYKRTRGEEIHIETHRETCKNKHGYKHRCTSQSRHHGRVIIKVLTSNPHAKIGIVWHVITQDAFRCPLASIIYIFCLSRPINLKVSRKFSVHLWCDH